MIGNKYNCLFDFIFYMSFTRIPLYGEFTCQNAITAERFIEAGSPYVSKVFLLMDRE